ncbi:IS1096 element passenger TnpR family protein [Nonomuraea africana]|uniref:IS1096 element passenger TnpR family protein n=1 Tax=Nonomuraea africana TaxID=46171 RepID=UPI0033CF5D16
MGTIHQLKITLRGVHPPVWRRVHVPSTATLQQLHEASRHGRGPRRPPPSVSSGTPRSSSPSPISASKRRAR